MTETTDTATAEAGSGASRWYNPVADRIDLLGATLIPQNWDEDGAATNDVTVHTVVPSSPTSAKLTLKS